MNETAKVLLCDGAPMVSIVHEPTSIGDTGVVILVAGGPQYRVGAHRQFILLARQLAAKGIPVIRFDHRGTGDSGGFYQGFTDMAPDIACAVSDLCQTFPQLKNIALWGECESASAAAYYAYTDPRIRGIFMVNPWVRTEVGLAKTYLKHHYRARLKDPDFWKKVRTGNFSFKKSFSSLISLLKQVISSGLENYQKAAQQSTAALNELPLTERLEQSLLRFDGAIMVVTSGHDHIAQEYKDFANSSKALKQHLGSEQAKFYEVADSDHTFSRSEWREDLFRQTENWLCGLSNS